MADAVEGSVGLSAGAVAYCDFPGLGEFSGTQPVITSVTAASTTMTTLGAIINPLDKPMRKRQYR